MENTNTKSSLTATEKDELRVAALIDLAYADGAMAGFNLGVNESRTQLNTLVMQRKLPALQALKKIKDIK